MRRGEHLRAQPHKKPVQAMRRDEHLRAQPHKKPVQAMRRLENLRAQPHTKRLQAMRRGEHLRAQPHKKQVQAMRRGEHRSGCKQCGGSSICVHSRIRRSCKDFLQKQDYLFPAGLRTAPAVMGNALQDWFSSGAS
jgi:hypothetical protein